jgi:hypothetical protein
MNKSIKPTKIGDILFTDKGWRKVTKTKPLEFSEDVIALPRPRGF